MHTKVELLNYTICTEDFKQSFSLLSLVSFATLVGGLSKFWQGAKVAKSTKYDGWQFSRPSELRHDPPGPTGEASIPMPRPKLWPTAEVPTAPRPESYRSLRSSQLWGHMFCPNPELEPRRSGVLFLFMGITFTLATWAMSPEDSPGTLVYRVVAFQFWQRETKGWLKPQN